MLAAVTAGLQLDKWKGPRLLLVHLSLDVEGNVPNIT